MILSLMVLLPLLGAILVYLLGREQRTAKILAILFSLIPLILSFVIWLSLDFSISNYQFAENVTWIETLNISYALGVDGLSFPLVLLTSLLVTLSMIFSWDTKHRVREFYAMLLLMETAVLGVFLSLDLFLFFIFWEVGLVPMYFLINIWGGPKRKYAAIKFFLYTQAASLLVLLGIIVIYLETGTFNMVDAAAAGGIGLAIQIPVFLALLVGFGVKMPIVPFHTWLPDAHVEAPTAGSVLLAGVLLKMGAYGIIRIGIEFMPGGAEHWAWLMTVIGVVSIIYGAILCLAQTDFKRMVAYSSVSHMGIVLLGVSTLTSAGMNGAIFQMFAHGLISGSLFMIAGVLLHKTGTRHIPTLRGLASKIPLTALVLVICSFASLGLPGLVGFVAEILVFMGTYEAFGYLVFIPLIGAVLTAGYYLWTLQKVAFGPYNEKLGELHDLYSYELIPIAILIFFIALFGIYPAPILEMITTYTGGLI